MRRTCCTLRARRGGLPKPSRKAPQGACSDVSSSSSFSSAASGSGSVGDTAAAATVSKAGEKKLLALVKAKAAASSRDRCAAELLALIGAAAPTAPTASPSPYPPPPPPPPAVLSLCVRILAKESMRDGVATACALYRSMVERCPAGSSVGVATSVGPGTAWRSSLQSAASKLFVALAVEGNVPAMRHVLASLFTRVRRDTCDAPTYLSIMKGWRVVGDAAQARQAFAWNEAARAPQPIMHHNLIRSLPHAEGRALARTALPVGAAGRNAFCYVALAETACAIPDAADALRTTEALLEEMRTQRAGLWPAPPECWVSLATAQLRAAAAAGGGSRPPPPLQVVAALRRAMRVDGVAETAGFYCVLLAHASDAEEAEAAYAEALAVRVVFPTVHEALMRAYERFGEPERATLLLERLKAQAG
eukprot:Rhum_TRINITY_DN10562_c0_g1::Rhum_TRINITY_DN10562_c0_g1_i1::g.39035::m.39035